MYVYCAPTFKSITTIYTIVVKSDSLNYIFNQNGNWSMAENQLSCKNCLYANIVHKPGWINNHEILHIYKMWFEFGWPTPFRLCCRRRRCAIVTITSIISTIECILNRKKNIVFLELNREIDWMERNEIYISTLPSVIHICVVHMWIYIVYI